MAASRGNSIVSWAVLIKLLFVLLLLLAASHHDAVPGLTSPRERDTPVQVWQLARGFDSNAYQRMATEGWYDDFTVGLPMGYPLAIRALLPLTGSAQTAALLVTNACALAALFVFLALARRLSGAQAGTAGGALLLCACLPGLLAFGTVAYSEGPWILVVLAAWWAYLRAESPSGAASVPGTPGTPDASGASGASGVLAAPSSVAAGAAARRGAADPDTPRPMGWLLVAALLAALSVQVRHAGVAFVGGLLLVEGWRVLRARAGRPRALGEALAFAALAALPTAAYLWFKFGVQDMGRAEQALFDTRFVLLGGLPSLLHGGTPPENVIVLYLTLPLALALLARLWVVDRRIALVTAAQLLLALSVTGIAAQSLNRLMWALAPLALGALAVRDRVLLAGACGVLFGVSLWCGVGHVLGTAAL